MKRPPERRHIVKIEFQADSWEEVHSALQSIERQFHEWEAYQGEKLKHASLTGGYTWGGQIEHRINTEVTHATWYAALQEYLREMNEAIPEICPEKMRADAECARGMSEDLAKNAERGLT